MQLLGAIVPILFGTTAFALFFSSVFSEKFVKCHKKIFSEKAIREYSCVSTYLVRETVLEYFIVIIFEIRFIQKTHRNNSYFR